MLAGWVGPEYVPLRHQEKPLSHRYPFLLQNIGPTATLLAELLNDAKAIYPGAWVRGVATDVSNYNGLGNQPQMGYDELVYAQNLAPLLTAAGYPAHFIVDQGRSGVQNYTRTGSDWCNNKVSGPSLTFNHNENGKAYLSPTCLVRRLRLSSVNHHT